MGKIKDQTVFEAAHAFRVAVETWTEGVPEAVFFGFGKTPFGEALFAEVGERLCALSFTDGDREGAIGALASQWPGASLVMDDAVGDRFSKLLFGESKAEGEAVTVLLKGTPFQIRVWKALLDIGFGERASYKEIADVVKAPGAFRAVGGANARNPVAFVVPCHRVVRASGDLGGYAGGVHRKEAMLRWESDLKAEARMKESMR